MRAINKVLAVLLILFSIPSLAWEYFPEFQTLTEFEETEFDNPNHIGGEYQSDLLTFTKPLSWQAEWLSQSQAFDLTIGSLSSHHFYINNRAKIHKRLNRAVEFRFTFFDERDRERISTHGITELVFGPWAKFGFSVYGEAAMFKRKNDFGFAAYYWPSENHEIKIFNTYVDLVRDVLNDRHDKFLGRRHPESRGIVGRWWQRKDSKPEFIEYSFRYETPAQWRFPDEEYDYFHSKKFVSLMARKNLNKDVSADLRFQWDRKLEEKKQLSVSSSEPEDNWRTERFWLLGQVEKSSNWLSSKKVSGGLHWASRVWQNYRRLAWQEDLIPFFWLTYSGWNQDEWNFGYDFTFHRKGGETSLVSDPYLDGKIEHRLNVNYAFKFTDQAELKIYLTFDADQLFTPVLFEGGNGQFRLTF